MKTIDQLYTDNAQPAMQAAPLDPLVELEAQKTAQDEQAARNERETFGEAFSRAVSLDHSLINLKEYGEISGFEEDPEFDLPANLDEVLQDRGIPLTWLQEFADANSQQEFDAMLQVYERRAAEEKYLAGLGGKGMAARIAASFTDPFAAAVDVAATVAGGAGAVNRVRRVGQAIAAAGASNAAVGATQRLVDPTYGGEDLLTDFVAGAAFGTLFEGVGIAFRPEERQALVEGLDRWTKRVKQPNTFGPDSASAARVGGTEVEQGQALTAFRDNRGGEFRDNLARDAEDNYDIETRSLSLRGIRSIHNIAASSAEPQARELARIFTGDPTQRVRRNADGTVTPVVNEGAASDLATVNRNVLWGKFRRSFEEAAKGYFTGFKGGMKRMFSMGARGELNRRVGRVMKGFADSDPNVQKAAAAARTMLDEGWDMMKRAGVRGMDTAVKAADYFPRLPRRHLDVLLKEKVRSQNIDETVRSLIAKGIRQYREKNGLPIDDELTEKVSKVYAARLLTKTRSPDVAEVNKLDLDDLDAVLETTGLSKDDKDKIMLLFTQKDAAKDAKVSQRLKERLGIDETASIELEDGSTMHVADLFEDDVEYVMDRYRFEASGLSALAEKGIANWKDAKNTIDDLLAQGRVTPEEARSLDLMLRSILGQPLEDAPDAGWAKFVRTATGFNFATQMTHVAFSMLTEFGPILGTASIRSMMKQVPAFKTILKSALTGKIDDTLGRELAALVEPGTSLLRNTVSLRADDLGLSGINGSRIARFADRSVQTMQRATSIVSLMAPLQDFQQQLFARAFSQRVYDFATGRQTISDSFMERLMDYGMSRKDVDALMEHFRANAKAENGVLKSINPDGLNTKLLRKVQVMLHRAMTHVVQEADIGATLPWMHSATAKVLTQFRTFSLIAIQRRTMHSLRRHDTTAFLMLSYGMMFGALGVTGRILATTPEDDPMRERVIGDPLQLAKSSFAAVGESGIFPMLWDTALKTASGGEAPEEFLFNNFQRSTGNAATALAGIPTVQTANRITDALQIPGRIVTEGEVTDKQFRNAAALLWVPQFMGIQRATREFAGEYFPSEYEAQQRTRERKEQ